MVDTELHALARSRCSLTFWYETEALLRGGDGDLARREVERVAALVGENRRYRLPLLRSQAVLAQWDGDVNQAMTHLQAALALAQEMGLPGEEWPILGALGRLYAERVRKRRRRKHTRQRPLSSIAWRRQLMKKICGKGFWRLGRLGSMSSNPTSSKIPSFSPVSVSARVA